ncbi:MAG: LuxR C-terminal-related transcriptional regulator [Coriobacteriales bacterium]|jgi:DNA-binding CsgD family transcriptional regulator|nr:LuxR C-terminal-related transcriptional regulator [Coriobacteriales bacterium]
MESVKTHFTVVFGSFGLIAVCVWMNLVGHGAVFIPTTNGDDPLVYATIGRLAFYAGFVLCGILMLSLNNRILPIRLYLDITVAVLFCSGTIGFGLAWHQDFFDPLVMSTVCSLGSGFGFAWIIRSYYLQLALKEPLKVISIVIAIVLVIEILATDLITLFMPALVQMIIGILLAPVSCVLLIIMENQAVPVINNEPKPDHGSQRFMVTILALTLFCAFLIRAVSIVGFWGNNHTTTTTGPLLELLSTVGALVLFAGFTWLVLLRQADDQISRRYQIPLLVLTGGYVVWLAANWILPDALYPWVEGVISAIELFGEIALWIVVVASIKNLRFGSYRILGATAIAYGMLSMLYVLFLESSQIVLTLLVLATVYAVSLVLLGFPITPGIYDSIDNNHDTNDEIMIIAERYHLTSRESEILTYLVHGRSRPYIQEKLFLSDGTIKTHTSHIYHKLGVHSRQQLLDLFEMVEGESK